MRNHLVTVMMWCGLGLVFVAAGCSSYYKVSDPATGKSFYSTKVKQTGKAGAVKFKDDKSGGTVTLQSSEVKEISGDEYEAGLKSQPMPQK